MLSGCRDRAPAPSASSSSLSSSSPPPVVTDARLHTADVTWPKADRLDRAALAALPAPMAQNVARAPVPVMVPKNEAMLLRATVVSEPLFYAFFASNDGVNVSLQGTRGAYGRDDGTPSERPDVVRGKPAVVSETDQIWTASWVENGVAYALSVECGQAGDRRCGSKDYVVEVADALAYIGGRPERATP